MRRRLKIAADVDRSGVMYAFLFGGVIGVLLAYPALPKRVQVIDPSTLRLQAGPIAGPLIGGTAMFLLFIIGILALNWLFIEAQKK